MPISTTQTPGDALRLNCVGTTQDLARLGIRLQEGLEVTLHDDELQVEGKVQYSDEERIWVASVDWERFARPSRSIFAAESRLVRSQAWYTVPTILHIPHSTTMFVDRVTIYVRGGDGRRLPQLQA